MKLIIYCQLIFEVLTNKRTRYFLNFLPHSFDFHLLSHRSVYIFSNQVTDQKKSQLLVPQLTDIASYSYNFTEKLYMKFSSFCHHQSMRCLSYIILCCHTKHSLKPFVFILPFPTYITPVVSKKKLFVQVILLLTFIEFQSKIQGCR